MASRSVVMARSAFSSSTKRNILVEEGMRILRNCSPTLRWETKAKFLTKLSISMMEAGHSEKFRTTVFGRVVRKYEVNLRNHNSGEKLMYRTKLEREEHFRKVGRSNKSSWFRKSGHTSTITLPATPDNKLVEMVKLSLASCVPPSRTSTKVLGGGGTSTKSILVKTNPFPRSDW